MNKGRFTTERLLGNQYARGNSANRTSFKAGQRMGWKGGLQKCDDGYYVWTGTGTRMRRGRYNYEKVNGEIPEGMIIYHIDGDCYNDDINNLTLLTRGELLRMNRNNK